MSLYADLSDLPVTSKDAKALVPILVQLFKDSEKRHKEMLKELKADLVRAVQEKDAKIQALDDEVSSLKKQVSKLEERIEENDQYERRDTLVFSGSSLPIATPNENCETVVRTLSRTN